MNDEIVKSSCKTKIWHVHAAMLARRLPCSCTAADERLITHALIDTTDDTRAALGHTIFSGAEWHL